MKQVTMYEAADGKQFHDPQDCAAYEGYIQRVKDAVLIPEVEGLNSDEYYQHDLEKLHQTRRNLFKIYLERHGKSFPEHKKWNPDEVHPMSTVGRVLDDAGGPLRAAWAQLMRTDMDTGREYNQPYFVAHPKEATKQRETVKP